MRSPTEIIERYEAIKADDFLGFRGQVLLARLPVPEVKPYLRDDADVSQWAPEPTDEPALLKELAEYMEFAWGKALDHRGISAERSVEKLTELLWLLGDEKTVTAVEAESYSQYGAPKLKLICDKYDLPLPQDERAKRMASGLRCRSDGCDEGCS